MNLELITEACAIATFAIRKTYSNSDEILSKYSSNLNMNADANINISKIESTDFFNDRITNYITPIKEDDTIKLLADIRNNPLYPISKVEKQIYNSETNSFETQLVDPLEDIEKLFSDTTPSTSLYSCRVDDLMPTKFDSQTVNSVSEQCCEPIDEEPEIFIEPLIDNPEITSIEELESVIADIQKSSDILLQCSTNKSESEILINDFNKLNDDLYSLYFYFKTRYNFLLDLEAKKVTPIVSVSAAEFASTLLTFKLSSIADYKLLKPANNNFNNQSGKVNDKYFLIVDNKLPFFEEVKTLFDIHNDNIFKDFIIPSDTNGDLRPYAITPSGTYYSEFMNNYNSFNRIDYLFTYHEQGYDTPKIPVDKLASASETDIESVKIDEEKATLFLQNYSKLEKEKVVEIIDNLKKDDFFKHLELEAKKEASRIFLYLQNNALLTEVIKLRKNVIEEFKTIDLFKAEIDSRISALMKQSQSFQDCIDEQTNKLSSKASQTEEDITPPGSDPYGGRPNDPRMPGPIKNYYWRQFTKQLQTVSFMPIPDVLHLNKRLFRYYPVGLRLPIPSPPVVLPTLAMGIPDRKISIPFPILWKHLFTLNTPFGQLVLWITYCAPYTVSPYLMYIDPNLNFNFLSTPRGHIEIPAKMLKWNKDNEKSLLDRIPGIKVPLSSIPSFDNSIDSGSKKGVAELFERIKKSIDKLDSSPNLSQKRIDQRTKIKKHKSEVKKSLKNNDVSPIISFLYDLKTIVNDKVDSALEFESFDTPLLASKVSNQNKTVIEYKNLISKSKLVNNENHNINVKDILKKEVSSFLNSEKGNTESKQLETKFKIKDKDKTLKDDKIDILFNSSRNVLKEIFNNMTPQKLGFVQTPNYTTFMLPEPAFSDISLKPVPVWMNLLLQTFKKDIVTDSFKDQFKTKLNSKIQLSDTRNSGKDILLHNVFSCIDIFIEQSNVPIPGWPNISYPESASLLNLAKLDFKNSLWKQKIAKELGGISPIKITPELFKNISTKTITGIIDGIFDYLISEFVSINSEQKINSSINIHKSLQIVKAIFGNDITDINEQDIKTMSVAVLKTSIKLVEDSINNMFSVMNIKDKNFSSFLKKFSPNSTQDDNVDSEAFIDISGDIAKALFLTYTAKYISGEKTPPPFPIVLMACSVGYPGWKKMTIVNPFSSLEKLPVYERMSLKNVSFVIFLDMIAKSAQLQGGIGSDYIAPYFSKDK